MYDQDPASLLIAQHPPLDAPRPHLDASLFDRIGNGLADSLLMVPMDTTAPSATHQRTSQQDDVLQRLCALADRMDRASPQVSSSTISTMQGKKPEENPFDVKTNAPPGLDLRALDILQPTIFQSFWTGARPDMEDPTLSQKADLPKEPPLFPAITPVHEMEYDRWNSRTVFGALSHPAAAVDATGKQQDAIMRVMSNLPKNKLLEFDIDKHGKTRAANRPLSVFTQSQMDGRVRGGEDDVGLVFELPALTKRPRDILDDCLDRERPLRQPGSKMDGVTTPDDDMRMSKAMRLDAQDSVYPKVDKEQGQMRDLDLWLSASRRPIQNDTQKMKRYDTTEEDERPVFSQLSWETCSRTGIPTSLSLSSSATAGTETHSPYVTEAGLPVMTSLFRRFVQ
ncbi:hypothetical protein EMPS_00719 [Entomortierella parvispora]|uniref:Uncharacterized protein n=1 Tax=Entomortierella parvispora TaxID=205924 RepID=A0A9P3H1G2_9FUNG|nr:hypothetical protein EMPS_00719 [Entomortierella parvispora]